MKFVVYGRPGCPYSVEAAKLAGVRLRAEEEMPEEYRALSEGHHTVPKVFSKHQFVGGLEDMQSFMRGAKRSEKCARRKRECYDSCLTTAELREMAVVHNGASGKGGKTIDADAPRPKLVAELKRAALGVQIENDREISKDREIGARKTVKAKGKTGQGRIEGCADRELCWMQRLNLPDELKARLSNAFAAEMPKEWRKKPQTWLTNYDIDDVMKRYAQHHPSFEFLGVLPMDFRKRVPARKGSSGKGGMCVTKMCNFSVAALPQGRTKLGAVLNLDYHTQRGSHWVALMAFIKPADPRFGVYYFDSVGKPPTPEVDEFVGELMAELSALQSSEAAKQRPPRYAFNNARHQRGNAECGMYAIYFIDRMLSTRLGFKAVCKMMMEDGVMNEFRGEIFQDSEPKK
jgi:glutaredoxin